MRELGLEATEARAGLVVDLSDLEGGREGGRRGVSGGVVQMRAEL